MSDLPTCVVVDEQPVVRAGIRKALEERFEVDEAADWQAALDAIRSFGAFDVAVLEFCRRPQDSIGCIREMLQAEPGLGIVAYGQHPDPRAAQVATTAGAHGFVAKSSPLGTLIGAADAAAAGETFVDPAIASKNGSRPITDRQRDVLQALADGATTDEAATRLGLSAQTVSTHAKGALSRLNAHARPHAVAIALRTGLID